MKKTPKILAAVLVVSTLAATLSGCSGGNKTNESVEFTEAASTAAGTSESTEVGFHVSSMGKTLPPFYSEKWAYTQRTNRRHIRGYNLQSLCT